MKEIKLGILITESNGHEQIIKACEDLKVNYSLIDIKKSNWLESIKNANVDGIIHRSFHSKQHLKDLMDERLFFIDRHLNIPLYPNYEETFIYENKNNMAYWLQANDIKHANTFISYDKTESINFLKKIKYPLVFKTKIGSAGSGVKFINNFKQGKKLVNKLFSRSLFGKELPSRGYKKTQKGFFKNIIPYYINLKDEIQHGFVMFQEKIKVKYEWRVIKLGESYFAHQKLIGKSGKHSGSLKVGWVKPPIQLLNFVKYICEIGMFNSMNVDVFESIDGEYYVNELQTIFGSYNNSQMYIDDVPGRYIYVKNKWVFEEGYFNQNGSMNLRVIDFIRIIEESKKNDN